MKTTSSICVWVERITLLVFRCMETCHIIFRLNMKALGHLENATWQLPLLFPLFLLSSIEVTQPEPDEP